MSTRISDLPAADALTGAELLPVVQAGTTRKVSAAALLAAIGGSLRFALSAPLLAGETVFSEPAASAWTIVANFEGSTARLVGGDLSAPHDVTIIRARGDMIVQIGALTLRPDGTFTLATAGGAPVAIAADDVIGLRNGDADLALTLLWIVIDLAAA